MAFAYNDHEALRIAMEIERKGAEYYTLMLDVAADARERQVIVRLLKQEEEHLHAFHAMYEAVISQHDDEGETRFDEDTNAYLAAVAEGVVAPGEAMEKPASMREALAQAVRSEKDSILFYQELAHTARNQDARTTFLRILKEEKAHLGALQGLMEGAKE